TPVEVPEVIDEDKVFGVRGRCGHRAAEIVASVIAALVMILVCVYYFERREIVGFRRWPVDNVCPIPIVCCAGYIGVLLEHHEDDKALRWSDAHRARRVDEPRAVEFQCRVAVDD